MEPERARHGLGRRSFVSGQIEIAFVLGDLGGRHRDPVVAHRAPVDRAGADRRDRRAMELQHAEEIRRVGAAGRECGGLRDRLAGPRRRGPTRWIRRACCRSR